MSVKISVELLIFRFAIVAQYFATIGCAMDSEEELFSLLNCDINLISVESGYGNVEIESKNSILEIVSWLKTSKKVDTRFASYPSTNMKLVFFSSSCKNTVVYISYPSYSSKSRSPNMVRYKTLDFSVPESPSIPEFAYYRKLSNPDNLRRKKTR